MQLDYERESLLRAICTAPEDDVPRLIYADWLDEHGEPSRAQFIRDQIYLAGLPKWHPDVLAAEQLNHDVYFGYTRSLGDKHGLPTLPQGLSWAHRVMQRGFGSAVEATTADALRDGLATLCQTSPINGVAVQGRFRESNTELIKALTQIPAMACVRRLEISLAKLTPEHLQMLEDCPHLSKLEVLELPFGGLSSRGAAVLPTLELFRRLRELHLRSTDYGDPAGPAFAPAFQQHGAGSRLEVLNLCSNHFGPRDLQFLASAPALESVRELYLSDCAYDTGFRAEGYQALANSPHAQQLEIMHLGKTEPTMAGIHALAKSPFPSLRYLDFSNNNVGPKGVAVLAMAPWLSQLTHLNLQGNPVKDSGLKHLLKARLPNLVSLNLSETKLSEAGLLSLADAPFASQLKKMDLYRNIFQQKATGQRLKAVFGEQVIFSGPH